MGDEILDIFLSDPMVAEPAATLDDEVEPDLDTTQVLPPASELAAAPDIQSVLEAVATVAVAH
jgi:hypothetical protein